MIVAPLFAEFNPPSRLSFSAVWPQFLGPGSRALSTKANLPDCWSATENVAWKTSVPGRGWSSPIVWGDRLFLTTVVGGDDAEMPQKGLYRGGERQDAAPAEYQWKVLCLDLCSGKLLWGIPPQARKCAAIPHNRQARLPLAWWNGR